MKTFKERAQGCLIGLAVGDAIGTTVEFKSRHTFDPVTDMLGGGPFNLNAGEWTDDTSMALCLAASLIENNGMNLKDQADRYVRWLQDGYMSSNGRCFDIGNATLMALSEYQTSGNPYAGSKDPYSAGNGCIMRLAPVPILFSNDLSSALSNSVEQAKVTHQAPECLTATHLFAHILCKALSGIDNKEQLLRSDNDLYTGRLKEIANGSYFKKEANQISGSGYVVDSLEAALWCFYTTETFKDAVLKAVNLGDDADTTAAICGQLAGAYYGISEIPLEWRNRLAKIDMILDLSDKLIELA